MSCAAFLKLCNGNCTDNSAFKDACIVECEDCPDCVAQLIITIAVIAALFIWSYTYKRCCFGGLKKSGSTVTRQSQNYSAVRQVPQAQVIAVNPPRMPVIPGRIIAEQSANKYSNKFTSEDWVKFADLATNKKQVMTTHDGVIIDKDLTILGRTRGSALNQPTVF